MAKDTALFEAWKREVDRELLKMCGLDSECLPDMPYWDWFSRRITPHLAARMALSRAKRDMGL